MMTFGEAVTKATSNGFLARVQAALITIAVSLAIWIAKEVNSHDEQLSGLTHDVNNLTITIREHDQREDQAIGRIVNVQDEEGREIAALKQAEHDREERQRSGSAAVPLTKSH